MQKRSALIIGNSEYTGPNTTKLGNPVNDANAMAAKLHKYGFQTTLVTNGSYLDMRNGLTKFGSSLQPGCCALVFFAGHGVQIDGENFLFACDTDATGENQAKYSSLSLNQVIELLEKSQADTKIVILDACRENPFEKSWHRSAVTRGLASVFAPRGTIIAFATSPGQIARDGRAENGVYTGALLQHIDAPDCPIETVFKRVRNAVSAATSGRQITWEHTSLSGDFYFNVSAKSVVGIYGPSAIADHLFVLDPAKSSHKLIRSLKSLDWYTQNPAADRVTPPFLNTVKEDNLFVLGRNLYQAANGGARSAESFIKGFAEKTSGTRPEKIRALLDGILFEIFFDSHGHLRQTIKGNMFDEAFDLQAYSQYKPSFDFISDVLIAANGRFHAVPGKGHTVAASITTTPHERGLRITGVFIDTINVLTLLDPDFEAVEGDSIIVRRLTRDAFERELSNQLIVPRRLLKVDFDAPPKAGETLAVPIGWGVSLNRPT
ncbi:hypothetical protein ASD01_13040 [Ensifer sp. Root423]|uniref:caspase family protein n=1 Tax=Ensifer sp. Root423 TaxID=1736534 RepID=UPI0007148449|nr:caspase family protein [Ensifer sp. Root423]KQX04895.1 hypothetical protein ASD01_13040 [Ensifer sp. Root423]